jgi:cold-inducible RNA-binding protein
VEGSLLQPRPEPNRVSSSLLLPRCPLNTLAAFIDDPTGIDVQPQDAPQRSAEASSRMARKLYVGNLPYETSEQDLQAIFGRAGTVESVNVVRDMATGRPRGFAFVEMATDEDAQAAIRTLADYSLGGRQLTVNEARPKTQSGGGGGDRHRPRRSEKRW